MNTVTFNQIKDNKEIREKEGLWYQFLLAPIVVGIGALLFYNGSIHPFIIIILCIVLLWLGRTQARKIFGDYANKNDIIGIVQFQSNSIIWLKNNVEFTLTCDEIIALNLHYNGIKGQQFSYRDIIHNGLAQLNITTKTGMTFQFKFIIETSEQLKAFKPIWKSYLKNKIKISEYMGNSAIKTLLFDANNLRFENRQKLKKELSIDDFL